MSIKRSHSLSVHVQLGWLCLLAVLIVGCSTEQNRATSPQTQNQLAAGSEFTTLDHSSDGAIIDNGVVQLGVLEQGHLGMPGGTPTSGTESTTTVGVRYLPTNSDSTAQGCVCEGWGVADAISGVWGAANEARDGAQNLTVESFTHTASEATSIIRVGDTFRVTHHYRPSAQTPNLYEVVVSVENISSSTVDLRYRRIMDWDIPPNTFSELVTIQGTTSAANVLYASNNGFAHANPLSDRTFDAPFPAHLGDFTEAGPNDHGALFDFGFGELVAGATRTFTTFYGAAADQTSALAALGRVGAEVYSFGQANYDGSGWTPAPDEGAPTGTAGAALGVPHTFIFAFAGVGGDPVVPPPSDPPGKEGCTPGYWKNRGNRINSWGATGYAQRDLVRSAFNTASFSSVGNKALLHALSFKGGSTMGGAAEILLRAATAALLNAAHPKVDYPIATAAVIADVNSALQKQGGETNSQWRNRMLTLATQLDSNNNLGCPLGDKG